MGKNCHSRVWLLASVASMAFDCLGLAGRLYTITVDALFKHFNNWVEKNGLHRDKRHRGTNLSEIVST